MTLRLSVGLGRTPRRRSVVFGDFIEKLWRLRRAASLARVDCFKGSVASLCSIPKPRLGCNGSILGALRSLVAIGRRAIRGAKQFIDQYGLGTFACGAYEGLANLIDALAPAQGEFGAALGAVDGVLARPRLRITYQPQL